MDYIYFIRIGIIQLSGDMLAMEDLINSVSIIATNPYKFVSLAFAMRASIMWVEERGDPIPPAALARK
jgi:hypothetical protein